jgi:uncharacterized Ntn-hydrolase superfamily protein
MLRDRMTAAEVSRALHESDLAIKHRQFAIVDANGRAVALTDSAGMGEAGRYSGDGFTCQANTVSQRHRLGGRPWLMRSSNRADH